MVIGVTGGAGPAIPASPNIVNQRHAGTADDTDGKMVEVKDMSRRNMALFDAASKWSKPEGTQTDLAELPRVKIAQSSDLIDQWDSAIDTNPGDVTLQSLTEILRDLFKGAFANKCKKMLLVSDKGQILMTRRGLGAEMYAHIEGERNYQKEKHLSINDNLTLSVLRALYRDDTVQKFFPLNGVVGGEPAAADIPDGGNDSDNIGSRPGSRRGPGPRFVPGPGYESDSESESDLESGAIFSGVLCHRFASPDAVICHRLADEPSVNANADHTQSDVPDFDKDAFDRDAGLTEPRNLIHSNYESLDGSGSAEFREFLSTWPLLIYPEAEQSARSAEQTVPKQVVSAADSELRVDTPQSIRPIEDADSTQENLIYMEVTLMPEGIVTQVETMDGHVDSKITPLPTLSLSPAPADISDDVPADNDTRIEENLNRFNARERIDYSIKKGVPRPVIRLDRSSNWETRSLSGTSTSDKAIKNSA